MEGEKMNRIHFRGPIIAIILIFSAYGPYALAYGSTPPCVPDPNWLQAVSTSLDNVNTQLSNSLTLQGLIDKYEQQTLTDIANVANTEIYLQNLVTAGKLTQAQADAFTPQLDQELTNLNNAYQQMIEAGNILTTEIYDLNAALYELGAANEDVLDCNYTGAQQFYTQAQNNYATAQTLYPEASNLYSTALQAIANAEAALNAILSAINQAAGLPH
jgi:hypothetical protein